MFGWPWFKREELVRDQRHHELLVELVSIRQDFTKQIAELKNSVEAAIKGCTCIICGGKFVRLPQQSDKRCPACQREIKQIGSPAIIQSNNGHRGAGHTTRGVHKGPKA